MTERDGLVERLRELAVFPMFAASESHRVLLREAADALSAAQRLHQKLVDVLARAERSCDADCIEAATDRIREAQRLVALLSERSPRPATNEKGS